jgi:hypothetical protein
VTDLASHLTGTKTLRSFIDTWVSNDDPQNGHGWRVTSKLLFTPGAPDPAANASEVISIWDNQAEGKLITIGDPAKPLADVMPARTITIPADAKKVALRTIVTGHGQGGALNCAEFCQLDYKTSVGSSSVSVTPWRDDCEHNPVQPQGGTFYYPRAGWCPGAYAVPVVTDITDKVSPGSDVAFDFSIADRSGNPFVNSCRPGAGGPTNTCTGCVRQGVGNCDDNGNGHTPAEGRVAVQLLIYR